MIIIIIIITSQYINCRVGEQLRRAQRKWDLKCTIITSYNWSHWNSNEKLKEKSGSYTRKTFDRFTAADSCTGNSTQHTSHNLKPERWRSPLVQGKYREEKACDKRQK
jgi:hypothetical protein